MPDFWPAIDQFLEAARNSPECFKCRKPITEFDEVRVVTVRVDDKPINVWVHADHAKPPLNSQAYEELGYMSLAEASPIDGVGPLDEYRGE